MLAENLRCSHVGRSPSDKCHCDRSALFRLACNVARDQRDDHVALSEKELSTIERNEEPASVGLRRSNGNDDGRAYDRRDCPNLLKCQNAPYVLKVLWDLRA